MKRIRVLVVDDSALARGMLRAVLESEPDFEVIGEARHGREAVGMVQAARPDLVTMDLEMPVMGGLEAIEEIMNCRAVPILVVSNVANAQNAYAAVARGALEVVPKPALGTPEQEEFISKARLVARVPVITHVRALRLSQPAAAPLASPSPCPPPPPPSLPPSPLPAMPAETAPLPLSSPSEGSGAVFVIASSTGGPQALATLLARLPAWFPGPVLIAQHIADGFAAGMAEWLASVSPLPVRLGSEGDKVMPGHVFIAPTEVHLAVTSGHRLTLKTRLPGDIYRPSCDVLLESAARVYGSRCVGIILTGMGSDGARGLAAVRAAGGRTLAQDEETSVIFGMNRVAIERGAVGRVLPLDAIPGAMLSLAKSLS